MAFIALRVAGADSMKYETRLTLRWRMVSLVRIKSTCDLVVDLSSMAWKKELSER